VNCANLRLKMKRRETDAKVQCSCAARRPGRPKKPDLAGLAVAQNRTKLELIGVNRTKSDYEIFSF